MRIMAVDYGDARTGVAVSDITRTLAGDAWVLSSKNMQETTRRIADEATNRGVSCIVVGYPKNMDGSIGERARKSELLAKSIKALCDASSPALQDTPAVKKPIEVVLWDERLTTKGAHRILDEAGKRGKARKQAVDAVAASLILESYLKTLRA